MDGPPQGRPKATEAVPDPELARFLRDCIEDHAGDLARHIDLDIGDEESPSLEPSLYRLLGVSDETAILLGISWINRGDLEACRAEWGEPSHRADIRREPTSDFCWDIWQMPGSLLREESIVGAGLILMASDPRWVLYTGPNDSNPMLFPTPLNCPSHPRSTAAATHINFGHHTSPT